ncbi:single-stranded DNA-binding protein [Rhizosphaericola mali]|uniref:Single-stranded DNA-binding protein n=1 Tax=Rhizosphaericola mali TaxID=2545455 RepID=A0A5P2G648_9BACT|nr:single-stranded DNA-binding protein [Rhizosphaericola mali]QES90767.1 single-stranded DNA-binding protein [Rhizosphaericola mali]
MRGVNKVILIGNLGKDPDVQILEGNIAVAKFPLATTETYKDRTGKLISQTEWHTVVLWRGLAELAQKYLHKSSLIYVEGHLKNRCWEDKEGVKKYATEIVGDNLIMLDKKSDFNSIVPGCFENNTQDELKDCAGEDTKEDSSSNDGVPSFKYFSDDADLKL